MYRLYRRLSPSSYVKLDKAGLLTAPGAGGLLETDSSVILSEAKNLLQWHNHSRTVKEFTAAGTVPDFHRLPF